MGAGSRGYTAVVIDPVASEDEFTVCASMDSRNIAPVRSSFHPVACVYPLMIRNFVHLLHGDLSLPPASHF